MIDMEVSIIVPAYNAEETILARLEDLKSVMKGSEIIVVCNGCTDKTNKIARSIKGIKVLEFREKLGKGGAIRKGIERASYSVIAFIDADNSFYASDMKEMVKGLGKYGCVIASKWEGKDFVCVEESSKRKFYGRVWNLLVKLLFGLNIKDTQAGMKVFKRQFIPEKFVSNGFEFDVELLYGMKKRGARILEYGVRILKNKKSTVKRTDILKMLLGLIKIKLKC